jgi:hypothetical protein
MLTHELSHVMATAMSKSADERLDTSDEWLALSGWSKDALELVPTQHSVDHPEDVLQYILYPERVASRYGMQNPKEDFAESVNMYRINPKKFLAILPEWDRSKYDFIKNNVFNGIEYFDSAQCDSLVRPMPTETALTIAARFEPKVPDPKSSRGTRPSPQPKLNSPMPEPSSQPSDRPVADTVPAIDPPDSPQASPSALPVSGEEQTLLSPSSPEVAPGPSFSSNRNWEELADSVEKGLYQVGDWFSRMAKEAQKSLNTFLEKQRAAGRL